MTECKNVCRGYRFFFSMESFCILLNNIFYLKHNYHKLGYQISVRWMHYYLDRSMLWEFCSILISGAASSLLRCLILIPDSHRYVVVKSKSIIMVSLDISGYSSSRFPWKTSIGTSSNIVFKQIWDTIYYFLLVRWLKSCCFLYYKFPVIHGRKILGKRFWLAVEIIFISSSVLASYSLSEYYWNLVISGKQSKLPYSTSEI